MIPCKRVLRRVSSVREHNQRSIFGKLCGLLVTKMLSLLGQEFPFSALLQALTCPHASLQGRKNLMGEFEDNTSEFPGLEDFGGSEWENPFDGLVWEVTNYLYPKKGKRVCRL